MKLLSTRTTTDDVVMQKKMTNEVAKNNKKLGWWQMRSLGTRTTANEVFNHKNSSK